MLEEKIVELTKAIEALTAVLTNTPVQMDIFKEEEPVEPVKPLKPVKPAKIDLSDDEALAIVSGEKPKQDVTHQELKDKCLKLVSEDEKYRPLIKELISSFGAKTIDKIPQDKLADLKEKLGSLK